MVDYNAGVFISEAKADWLARSRASGSQEDVLNEFMIEFIRFIASKRKWWLIPILVLLAFLALIVASGPIAPFIYTLF